MAKDTMLEHLGITFSATGDDYIEATMPVDARTVQPFGVLHGGASVTLAESLGSVAAHLCVEDPSTHTAVGVEINASHLRSVPHGQFVTGRATPGYGSGGRMQVWNIDIRDGDERLICTSRLTVAIVERSGLNVMEPKAYVRCRGVPVPVFMPVPVFTYCVPVPVLTYTELLERDPRRGGTTLHCLLRQRA